MANCTLDMRPAPVELTERDLHIATLWGLVDAMRPYLPGIGPVASLAAALSGYDSYLDRERIDYRVAAALWGRVCRAEQELRTHRYVALLGL